MLNFDTFFIILREHHEQIKAHCTRNTSAVIAVYQEICYRAKFANSPTSDLESGQCFIGVRDLADELDLGRQSVRSALERLEELTLIQPTTNQRGTVVTLLDSRLFEQGKSDANHELTLNQHLTNNNKNNNNKNNNHSPKVFSQTTQSKKKKERKIQKERKSWEVRDVAQEEVRQMCLGLQDSLGASRNPVHYGMMLLYLRTFATEEDAEADIERIFQSAQSTAPEDVDGQVRYVNACIGKHLAQMKEAYGD